MLNSDDFDSLFDEYKKNKVEKKPLKLVGITSVEKLPLWMDVKKNIQKPDNYKCLVCRQTIDDEDIVEACTSCERYFHYKHIREWLRIKTICPNCKIRLTN